METPVRIEFTHCNDVEGFRTDIEALVAGLEKRFGHITACRVIVRGPGGHHSTGGLYTIGVHLELPDGRHVDVQRTPDADERYGDPRLAIRDAFKRARRILQDNVRQMQGNIKLHEQAPIATVHTLRPDEGYGFLETSDGREIYFHENSVLSGGFARLKPGMRVTFVEEPGDKGPQASTVKLLGKHGLRLG